jgi:hypothetical protein
VVFGFAGFPVGRPLGLEREAAIPQDRASKGSAAGLAHQDYAKAADVLAELVKVD